LLTWSMTRRRAVGRRSRSSRLQSAAYARRKIASRISRNPVLAVAASSMLTELACNAGAMRKETLLVKFAMRNTSLVTLRPLVLSQMRQP